MLGIRCLSIKENINALRVNIESDISHCMSAIYVKLSSRTCDFGIESVYYSKLVPIYYSSEA